MFSLFSAKPKPLISPHNPLTQALTEDIERRLKGQSVGKSIELLKEFFYQDDEQILSYLPYFYQAMFDLIEGALEGSEKHLTALEAYSAVFTSDKYLGNSEAASDVLASKAEKLTEYLKRCIEHHWAEDMQQTIEDLFDVCFLHNHYLLKEGYAMAAQLILPFLQRYPQANSFSDCYINEAENAQQIYLDIFAWAKDFAPKDNPAFTFWFNMIGPYAETKEFAYKNSVEIVKQLLAQSQYWTKAQQQNLVGIGLRCFVSDHKPEEYHQQALRCLNRDKTSAQVLKMLIDHYPDFAESQKIYQLFAEADILKAKPKLYDLKQKPQIQFKDLALTLAVIDKLMYQTDLLQPRFELKLFAQEYEKRLIDVEEEGYEIIPEVKSYFKNLDIPAHLLNQVEELYIDGGFDGGSELYENMWRFYDPGNGDELLPISNKAIEDLDLLPNLRKITGLENCNPPVKLIKALQQRGIKLIAQD